MDVVDQAQHLIEQDLEIHIAAARGQVNHLQHTHCQDCDEPLEPHRRRYGTCIECQTRRERLSAIRVRGRHE